MSLESLSPIEPAAPVYLVRIGNISATKDWIVTPAGALPCTSTNVSAADQTSTTTHTPAWAIVLVIVFIWSFFLSLLFLLAKETRVVGYVAITLQSGEQAYTEHVPVNSAAQGAEVFNRVAYLQSLIGQARYASS